MRYIDEPPVETPIRKRRKLTELEKAERFYRKGLGPAYNAIRAFLRDSPAIVYGARAVNAHLPDWLDKDTKDWDIFVTDNAERYALELEKKLDAKYGGDFFYVEPAIHPGTFRVWSRVSREVVADVTLKDREVTFHKIKGINYATLEYQEQRIAETMKNPEARHRINKDMDTLQRIKISKKLRERKRRSRRPDDGLGSTGALSGLRFY